VRRIVFPLVFVVVFSASLHAQVPSIPGTVTRDQNALSTLQAAITALGGATAIGQAQSWQAQGQVQGTAPQGKAVTAITGTITWEMAGSEMRIASATNAGPTAFLTGHGNPAVVSNANSLKLPPHVVAAMFVPAFVGPILLKDFQNSDCELRSGGPKNLGTESVQVVHVLTTGIPYFQQTAQTWYFDSITKLPVRVEFRIPSMRYPQVSIRGALNFSNYSPVASVLYPFQIVTFRDDKQTSAVTIQSVNVNVAIPSSDFDPPTAGAQ